MAIFNIGRAIIVCERNSDWVEFTCSFGRSADLYESSLSIPYGAPEELAISCCKKFIVDVKEAQARIAISDHDHFPSSPCLVAVAL